MSLTTFVIPILCFGQMKNSVQQSTAVPIEFSLERTASQIASYEEKKGRTHYQLYINGALKTLDADGNPSYVFSWLGNRKIYQYTLEGYSFTGYSGDNVEILRRSHSNFYGDFSPCTTFTLEEGKTIYIVKCQ